MIKSATAAELHKWLQSGEAALVDVREADEYAAGHIAGSTFLPLATVTAKALPSYQGKKLVMQCRSGGRSRAACAKLTQEIADLEVYNLEGGITAWVNAGFPIEK